MPVSRGGIDDVSESGQLSPRNLPQRRRAAIPVWRARWLVRHLLSAAERSDLARQSAAAGALAGRAGRQVCRPIKAGLTHAAIAADLVIDASGRGAPTLALLDALGWARPPETAVGVDIGYTTVRLPQPSAAPGDAKILYTLPDPPAIPLAALLIPIENGQSLVTLCGWGTTKHPQSWDEFLAALRQLRTPTIYNAIRDLPPPDSLKHYLFEESRWRHFEQLPSLPRGLLPVADSLCRFNPVYGQGMSVAARQAKLLHDTLARVAAEGDPIRALQKAFMANVAPLLQAPWIMGVNADFAFPSTRGERPERYEEGRQFEAALFRATVADPVVQRAFSDVMQLVKPFDLLESPDIQSRIKACAEHATPDEA